MEKKSFKKVKLAVAAMLLSICMAVVLPITSFAEDKQLIYGTDGTITRAEWVHDLVTAFDMTMSEGLKPDNYYADIAENQYYNDILTAMYFGVIDLEAGEKFEPDGKVTREFAAHTLSYCMGYELEKDTTYTMSDIGELLYPNDDQIAVNKGWFSLVSGKFMPGQYVSSTEVKAMLDDAAKVLEESKVDANHENQYTFESGVKEVPESSRFEFSGDNEITLYDTSAGIQTNDVFAVYSNGIAYTYKAVNVETKEDSLVITTEDVMYEDAVKYVDAEGVIEADLNDFVPEEGVSTEVEYAEEEMGAQSVSGTKKIGKVNISKSFGAGSVNCSISNIKVDYKINNSGYRFAVTGKINTKCSFSGKKDLTLTLGYINVAGVGKVQLQMIYSAKGSATVGFTTNAITGVEKKKGQAVRHLDNYTSPTWNFSAKAELKTACNLNFSVDIPMVANGRVYGETGIKSTPEVEVYTDGNTPKTCMDLPVYLYAEAGCSLNVFGESLVNETVPIYTASNSPIRICYHIEDGKCVKACSRPGSSSRVGKRGYYTSPDLTSGSGTYGGECFAAPYEEVKIFEYKVDSDGNATITKYSGNVSALTIPDDIDGYPVVAIGANAFSGNGYLQSVVVPDGVTSIGEGAFLACPKLSQVALSPKLKVLGGYAFGDCDSLTSITIPKSLEKTTTGLYPNYIRNFQWGVFIACDNLKNITFEEGTTKIANGLFANNDSIEKIVIPNTVTSIENDAFYKCSKLKEVSFSNSLISIGSNAFSSDKLIEKAEIPDTVTTIKEGAFLGCSNLSEVKLSKRLKELGGYAFGDCDSLTSITIPKSLEKTTTGLYPNYIRNFQWGVFIACDNLKNITFEEGTTKIANGLFANNDSIEKIVIPNTVTSIENDAFYKCSKLKEVSFSNSLISIGSNAFSSDKLIEKAEIPDTVTTIKEGAFLGCSNLSEVKLSKRLKELGGYAFGDCDSLTSITIPKSLEKTTMGLYPNYIRNFQWGVFISCDNLKNITFEEGTTKIVNGLFANNDSIEKVVIPNTVTSIENDAFYKCSKLKQIDIPNSVTYIGTYDFAGCVSLEQIKLPKNIVSIEEGTFSDCTSLDTIQLPDNLQKIGPKVFTNCTSLKSIKIPSNVTKIDEKAFSNCDSLNDVTLPEGLTSIGREAFNLCISLEKICFPDSLQELGVYAFAECEKLSDITFGAGIKKVPNYCFYKDGEITAVILPQQMTAIGQYAFGNCVKLQEITINRKVNAIDATAFSYPSKMKIFGVKNTYAETFANENDITFEALNKPATAIKLSRTECEIPKGKKLLITASIEPTDSSDELLWSSEDEEIVKVVDGVITPVNVGTTYVQAQAGNVVQKCKVTVYQPVTRVNLNLTSKEMQIGSTLQLSASVYPDNAAKKDVIWKSDAEDIATVGEDGLVKALACGTANITVKTLDGGFERTCKITVVEAAAPTPTPTVTPTAEPQPTVTPTAEPQPTAVPTTEPQPTAVPTTEPQPTAVPTTVPTTEPQPTAVPTTEPQPTVVPTTKPQPTAVPTTKPQPTVVPTTKPQPTAVPTQKPQSTVKPQQPQAPNTSTGMSAGGNNSNNANTGANNSNSGSSNISGGSYGNAGNATTVSKITMWKITQKGKGKVKVIWKKVIGSSGYQVQYSLNKKMRAAKLKNCKAASLTIKKLKKKKAYYVRVRAYKRVNGRKVYGKWSGVKKVKIKK